MKCTECGGSKFKKGSVSQVFDIGGKSYEETMPAKVCAACGTDRVDGLDLQLAERRASYAALRSGDMSGAAFKFARKSLGLKATDFASLLGVSAFTLSRWETGERDVDVAAWAVLGAMVADKLDGRDTTRDLLEAAGAKRTS